MRRAEKRLAGWFLAIVGVSVASPASGQEQAPANVHWAYSAYFGTGWYSVEDDRDVFIFRVLPEWKLSEASLASGERRLGWILRTPISTGLDQFSVDDIIDAANLDNVAFLSVNPTLEVEIPVSLNWSLRPYASLGYGTVFENNEDAWSYWAGVKSRYTLHSGERSTWHLINQLGYVGYTPSEGPDDSFWPAMAGIEVSHPFGRGPGGNDRWLFHWKAGYTYFGSDVFFSRAESVSQAIRDEWEIGAALGRCGERLKIWFLSFDRLGIGYRSSSNGTLSGVTFFFRSAFER